MCWEKSGDDGPAARHRDGGSRDRPERTTGLPLAGRQPQRPAATPRSGRSAIRPSASGSASSPVRIPAGAGPCSTGGCSRKACASITSGCGGCIAGRGSPCAGSGGSGWRPRVTVPSPTAPNRRWSMDFVHDSGADGRRFRMLNVLDEGNREALGIDICPASGPRCSINSWRCTGPVGSAMTMGPNSCRGRSRGGVIGTVCSSSVPSPGNPTRTRTSNASTGPIAGTCSTPSPSAPWPKSGPRPRPDCYPVVCDAPMTASGGPPQDVPAEASTHAGVQLQTARLTGKPARLVRLMAIVMC